MDASLSEVQSAARPGTARRMATTAVLLGLVVSAFETTVVTSVMPTLTREFSAPCSVARPSPSPPSSPSVWCRGSAPVRSSPPP